MRKFFALMLMMLLAPIALATTYNFTPATANGTIVSGLAAGSGGGNIYNFAAGTYTQMTASWIFPCVGGNVFQGATATFVRGSGVAPSTIFAPTFTASNAVAITGNNTYTTAGNGCTIQYLRATGQNFYTSAPVSGMLFQFNKADAILCEVSGGGNTTAYGGLYLDWNPSSVSTVQDIGYSIIQWNTWGPSGSDVVNLNPDPAGGGSGSTCGGVIVHGSNVNLYIINNNSSGYLPEFIHTLGQSSSGNSFGDISTNLLIQNNDCNEIHRICIETQQENVTNQVVQYNDFHDPYNPQLFSFGISNACCTQHGGSTAPGTVTNYNLIADNMASCSLAYCMGYAIEAWGYDPTYNGNLIQGNFIGNAIAFGSFGLSVTNSPTAINNIMQGAMGNTVVCEDGGTLPSCTNVTGTPVYTPNTSSSTISQPTNTKPHISPLSGAYASPPTVTLNDSQPNLTLFYTTDGSTPTTSSIPYVSPFTLGGLPKTVKVLAVWGRGANPFNYPAGYGYANSAVASATYTRSSPAPPPKVASINLMGPQGAWIGRNGSTNWPYIPVDSNGWLMVAGAPGSSGSPRIASKNLVGPNGAVVGRKASKLWTYVPTDGAGNLLVDVH